MEEDNVKIIDLPEIIDADNQEYIIIRQLPIIEERMAELSADIDTRISSALALECTEDTVKTVKDVRAALNKESQEMEKRRKQVKNAVVEPYNNFEASYKKHIGNKYTDADKQLKDKIQAVENGLKQIKRSKVERYYNELCASLGIDFAQFARWDPNVTLSVTTKALKAEADKFIGQIADALEIIRERGDDREEVMVEYQRTLNLRESIETVTNRHKAVEEQKQRQAERETQRAAFDEAMKKVEAVQAANVQQALVPPVELPKLQEKDPHEVIKVYFLVEGERCLIREGAALFKKRGAKTRIIPKEAIKDEFK